MVTSFNQGSSLYRFSFLIIALVTLAVGAPTAEAASLPAASASAGSRRIATVVRADARTGRLIRSAVVQSDPVRRVAVQPTMVQAPAAGEPSNGDLEAMVDRIASEEGVDRSLVHSVIRAESNYNLVRYQPKALWG